MLKSIDSSVTKQATRVRKAPMRRVTSAVPRIGLELPSANSRVASVGLSVSLPMSSAFFEMKLADAPESRSARASSVLQTA